MAERERRKAQDYERDIIEGGGCQSGQWFLKRPSGYCVRIPDATDRADAIKRAREYYGEENGEG